MSLCAHHHIVLWGCRRTENGFTGFTTARGYRRLHPYARKAGVTARVGRRYGLPFLLYRYRRRTGIAAGVLICILFLIISQQFVWVVRIEGNERIDSQVLYQALEEMGVRRGTRKGAIDEREIARALPGRRSTYRERRRRCSFMNAPTRRRKLIRMSRPMSWPQPMARLCAWRSQMAAPPPK